MSLLILKIAWMQTIGARPSRADLSIILGPVVPFRRTQHALFDVICGIAHEVYESKHSKHLRHHFEINIY